MKNLIPLVYWSCNNSDIDLTDEKIKENKKKMIPEGKCCQCCRTMRCAGWIYLIWIMCMIALILHASIYASADILHVRLCVYVLNLLCAYDYLFPMLIGMHSSYVLLKILFIWIIQRFLWSIHIFTKLLKYIAFVLIYWWPAHWDRFSMISSFNVVAYESVFT